MSAPHQIPACDVFQDAGVEQARREPQGSIPATILHAVSEFLADVFPLYAGAFGATLAVLAIANAACAWWFTVHPVPLP